MKNIVIIGGETGVGLELLKSCLKKGYRVAISSKEKSNFDFKINKDMFYSKSFDTKKPIFEAFGLNLLLKFIIFKP